MRIKKSKIFIAVLLSILTYLSFAWQVSAQDFGRDSTPINLTADGVYNILVGLACYLIDIAGMLAVLAMAYSGILYMTARGDQARVTKAKAAFGYSLLGLAIIVGVYVIISTVANAAGRDVSFFSCSTKPVTTEPDIYFDEPEDAGEPEDETP